MKKNAIAMGIVFVTIIAILFFIVLYSNRNYIDTEIGNEYKAEILNKFNISLPDKGNVKMHEFDVSNEFVEFYLNAEEYENIVKQIEQVANVDIYDGDLNGYIEDDDIEKEYWISGRTSGCYCQAMHSIYVSKVKDNVFRLIFELDEI